MATKLTIEHSDAAFFDKAMRAMAASIEVWSPADYVELEAAAIEGLRLMIRESVAQYEAQILRDQQSADRKAAALVVNSTLDEQSENMVVVVS